MKSLRTIIAARETVSTTPSATILEAAGTMARNRIGALPVVDGDRLAGIFTERDLVTRVVAAGLDPAATSVAGVMSTELVAAEIAETYDVCLKRMQQAHVRHLIVLDHGRLAGIVSLRDLMAVDLDEKDDAITLLNAYVHYVPADAQAKI